ncbi:MAG: prolipoprotein diacylglyceryl transferase [Candidatus Eisenbacteria bacterium]|nr:prolipoprotein diacylglyceryl transferase [Candidatus Eisenbacteria bacterium]
MHPEILHVGILHLKSYGLALTLAFLVGTHIAMRRARRVQVPEDLVVWLALIVLFLAVAGSRTQYVVTHMSEFRGDVAGVFMIWAGGLSMYGGLIAAVIGGLVFIRWQGYSTWKVADVVAPSIALGEAITRIGCFMNGCCFGTPTCLPWGIVFPDDSFSATVSWGTRIHPSQLYLSCLALVIFFFLLWYERRKKFQGQLFWTCLLALAVARVLIDFTRYYDEGDYIGRLGNLRFNNNQLIAAGFITASIVMMRILRRRAR